MNSVQLTEIWRDVGGYEGHYQVSSFGRIRSLIGWNGHEYISRKKIVSGWVQKTDVGGSYKRRVVRLAKDGEREEIKVHRLVAMEFIANPDNKPNINHKDGNPLNNCVDNLEWCTQKENIDHAILTGLRSIDAYENEKEIIDLYVSGISIREISNSFNSCQSTISKVISSAGLEIRGNSHYKNKYSINKEELAKDFENGMRNKDIAIKHKTNSSLVATYRYKHRKGELL